MPTTKKKEELTPELEKYNTSKQLLAQNTQQQYEDAYVQQQLMDKYLKQNLAQQGLADSGIANLYAQQNNTNYMNQRADIAKTNMLKEQELYDAYSSAVQEKQDKEQKDFFDLAVQKVDNSRNALDGKLDEGEMIQLEDYFTENKDMLGDHYYNMINEYIRGYERNDDERAAYQDKNYTKYMETAGSKLDQISEGVYSLTDENYDSLMIDLDNAKSKIGEENYNNAKQALTAYKLIGDITERIDSSGKLSSSDYTTLKTSVEELHNTGMITSAVYNELLDNIEKMKLTVEQEKDAEKQEYQQYLQDNIYDTTGKEYNQAIKDYLARSDDAYVEKMLRQRASGIVSTLKTIGKGISNFWNKFIFN